MKWPALILIAIAAFLTAATIHHNNRPNLHEAAKAVRFRLKQLSIRCSPLYTPSDEEVIPRLTGWGNYSWKITTSSDSAQFYFDQGINMYYAFHIIESRASFDKATHFDPGCAMAWWGKALAFGPNINDFGYQRPSEAYSSATKANELKNNSTNVEKALIQAMAVRYSNDTTKDQSQLNVLYKEAMNKVYKDYGNKADVAALYADALMLLHPWDLYNSDYTAKPWTPEIISVLKSTMKLNPNHPGANHYYIHAMEASATPRAALKSAEFLSKAMPSVSHITHMPSHIYIRTGYYNKGIEQNDKALQGYDQYLKHFPAVNEGIALYSLHNTHMKLNCAQMAGNYSNAISAAKQLQQDIPPFYLSLAGAIGNYVQYLYQSTLFTRVRFGKWEDILKEKVVDTLGYTSVLQHFARGLASAKTNKITDAKAELEMMQAKILIPSLKEPLAPFNSAYDAALVAENILAGVIAEQQKDYTSAVAFLQKAAQAEDSLIYNEPRDWPLPSRQYLGDVLLKAGKYSEAFKVFNADLAINPDNGWDLTGIEIALKKMNKKATIAQVQRRIKDAWLIKDVAIDSPVF